MELRKKHYGKLLKKHLKRTGVKKYFIADKLKVSRPTFNLRLVDGDFTEFQIKQIEEILK